MTIASIASLAISFFETTLQYSEYENILDQSTGKTDKSIVSNGNIRGAVMPLTDEREIQSYGDQFKELFEFFSKQKISVPTKEGSLESYIYIDDKEMKILTRENWSNEGYYRYVIGRADNEFS